MRRELAKEFTGHSAQGARPTLVLASASPRRLMLLSQVGIEPDALRPSSIDESARRGEMPRAYAARIARAKAETARDQIANDKDIASAYVLAADTVVAVGRRILMKPSNIEEAANCLQLLSGRAHRVLTSVCLITPDDRVRHKIVDTRVRFKHLSREEIEAYIASREWRGKAGGYAIQGLAGCFVQKIVGSYSSVVGLPLTEVVALLVGEGFPIHFAWVRAAELDRPDVRQRWRRWQATAIVGCRAAAPSAAQKPRRPTGRSARRAAATSTWRAGWAAAMPSPAARSTPMRTARTRRRGARRKMCVRQAPTTTRIDQFCQRQTNSGGRAGRSAGQGAARSL